MTITPIPGTDTSSFIASDGSAQSAGITATADVVPIPGTDAASYRSSDGSLQEAMVVTGSGGGGDLPAGDARQVMGFDSAGAPVATTLGWAQFSDQPEFPPFITSVLAMSGEIDPDNPEFGFVELTEFVKSNTLPLRVPGIAGGQIKAADAFEVDDCVTLRQLDARVGVSVADATEGAEVAAINALLASLRAAGLIAE